MPLPLVPIAGFAAKYGSVALITYIATRNVAVGRRDQRVEDSLDDLDEGLSLRTERGQANTTAKFHRDIRLGKNGMGLAIDISAVGRFSIKRL